MLWLVTIVGSTLWILVARWIAVLGRRSRPARWSLLLICFLSWTVGIAAVVVWKSPSLSRILFYGPSRDDVTFSLSSYFGGGFVINYDDNFVHLPSRFIAKRVLAGEVESELAAGLRFPWLIGIHAGHLCVDRAYAYRIQPGYQPDDPGHTYISVAHAGKLDCPVSFITAAACLHAALITYLAWRYRRIADPAAMPCLKCGYDLRHNTSGRCPECGNALGQST